MIAGRTADALDALDAALAEADARHDADAAAEALDWLFWVALIELDGSRTRACAERLLAMSVPSTSPSAFRLTVRHAIATLQLGDALGALAIVERAEQLGRDADIEAFTMYLSCKADVLGALGREEPAVEYARLAYDISRKRDDAYSEWMRATYLGWALQASGRLAPALDVYLAAADTGRAAALTWEPAFATSRAAWIAFLLGDVERARTLIDAALAVRWPTPHVRVLCGWIALRMGLALGDDTLIAAGADPAWLDRALASADAYSTGPIVAAFHELYRSRGDDALADDVLHAGFARITSPDSSWALFAPVASYGDEAMIEKADALLDRFPPTHRVARAYRRLFAALVALRSGDAATGERLAGEAQLLFEDIACAYEAARCLAYSGRVMEARHRFAALGLRGELARLQHVQARRGRPRAGYHTGQQRREIRAMLVQGFTVKEIANRLGVSDRTVKARVAEIYDVEGVNSRADLLSRLRAAP